MTRSIFTSSRNLAFSTLVSRILGFLRDMIMAAVLGGGMVMSAWAIASKLANILRRILGEGALGSALVPILLHTEKESGAETAKNKFSTVFIYLVILLAAITLAVSIPAYAAAQFITVERWRLACLTIPVIMPYSIFICAVGIMTSYMNSFRVYFWPSVTAVLQNLVIIAALFAITNSMTDFAKLEILAFATLCAGAIELAFMFFLLKKAKRTPVFSIKTMKDTAVIKETLKLALPGMLGASAYQLSVMVDGVIAGCLNDYAAAALYYSDRVILLPVGIFAVAFGTVSLTEMSSLAAKKDYPAMMEMMMKALKGLLFITIPVTIFFFFFGKEILSALFMRENFTETDLEQVMKAFYFYVWGIPLFAAIKVTVTGFTARKDMKTPFKAALLAIAINIVLNLALMFPLAQGGIALATVASSLVNNTVLLVILHRTLTPVPFGKLFVTIIKITAASACAMLAAYPAARFTASFTDVFSSASEIKAIKMALDAIFSLIPAVSAFIVYCAGVLAFSYLLKVEELRNFTSKFLKSKRKEA